MKPLLKWVGGKTQILEQVFALFPKTCVDYHEPFLGGGSILLGMEMEVSGTIYASDVNPRLINFYQVVQKYPEELIVCCNVLKQEFESSEDKEAFYYKIRDMFNTKSLKEIEDAATFLFLNKTCFRGVYREGPRGFNVPFGHYKTLEIFRENDIRAISKRVQDVVFTCQSFEESLKSVGKNDFVYVDPPYVPENTTSFVGYVAGGFVKHSQLFDMLKQLPCKFVMSNSGLDIVKNEFVGAYTIISISARRAIHSKDPSSRTEEVLITNTPIGSTS
jgi:DNA adenine methylase